MPTEPAPEDPSKRRRRPLDLSKAKIVYADTSARDALGPWVTRVLESVGARIHRGAARAWVSDESTESDFMDGHAEADLAKVALVSADLGVPVAARDYIVEIASRLAKAER